MEKGKHGARSKAILFKPLIYSSNTGNSPRKTARCMSILRYLRTCCMPDQCSLTWHSFVCAVCRHLSSRGSVVLSWASAMTVEQVIPSTQFWFPFATAHPGAPCVDAQCAAASPSGVASFALNVAQTCSGSGGAGERECSSTLTAVGTGLSVATVGQMLTFAILGTAATAHSCLSHSYLSPRRLM